MPDTTKFNFLPSAYDKIIYVDSNSVDAQAFLGVSKTVHTNGVGLFIPIVVVSLDGNTWYSGYFPPIDNNGNALIFNPSVRVESDKYIFSGSRSTNGKIYYKVLGIEI